MKTVLLAALCFAVFSVNAGARQRHKPTGLHKDCNITMPCTTPSKSTPEQARVMRGRYISRQVGFGGPVSTSSKANKIRHKSAVSPQLSTTQFMPGLSPGITRPARFIAGRLVCAVNVGAALAERGINGTGSALAMSYRTWGRSAGGPVPGAVIVSKRRGGGHVAIVSRVENGIVYAWNATGGRNGWREIQYRHAVIDYRVPG